MAKPSIKPTISSKVDEEIRKVEARNAKLLSDLTDHVQLHGTLDAKRKELQDVEKECASLQQMVDKLKDQRSGLERWIKEFEKTTRTNLEKELGEVRSKLQAEILELRQSKATEEESLRTLFTAQEVNHKQTLREAQALTSQLAYLREHQDFCRKESERLADAGKKNAADRHTLNARTERIEERERKLEIRESEINRTLAEAAKIERAGNHMMATAKRHGENTNAMQEEVRVSLSKLDAERHAFRNELTAAKAEVAKAKAEYDAIRANQTALERRERLVEAKERALKRKGITLELD